jgi:hypothetical protein
MADTLRVDVCYRPLRIGWAVCEGDIDAIRQAIRYSHALWGGRFNPILVIDREAEARQLVELFRVDVICPLGDSQEVNDFPKKFPHLISPFHGDSVFVKNETWGSFAHVLDIFNAISHWQNKPDWKVLKDAGLRAYQWQRNDALADVFLIQLGAYPSGDEIGMDYAELIAQAAEPTTYELQPQARIPADILEHPHFANIGQLGIQRHYTVRPGWDAPGFFVGNAADPDDVVCFWNLRACDIALWFVDPAHMGRYADVIPELGKTLQRMVEHRRHEWDRRLGVWSRQAIDTAAELFGDMQLTRCHVHDDFWLGGSVSPPMMSFGEASTLGVMGESNGVPQVSFAFANKPLDGDVHFHTQQLVASVSLVGGLYDDEENTFEVPYVPELNEFYARNMHFDYAKFRIEPERLGLVIHATDHDSFLKAMPVSDLVTRIFSMAGFESKLSNSGRIVRQLLTQLGGLQGARAFKIPGARQLLKKFGPRDTFTRETARDVIVDKTPEHRSGSFSAHTGLFLGPRPMGTQLTPPEVFSYMVDKGLFRMGVDLDCAKCGMSSWVALDALKQQAMCELCGHSYDATRQLLDSKWRFRRSGVLGAERNAQGAVPVALTLQQLDANFNRGSSRSLYSASLDLQPTANVALPKCEVDFVWLIRGRYPDRSAVILAECKDQGPIKLEEFQRDVDNIRRIADALPKHRFVAYALFVKLAPFTAEEIASARTLNSKYERRVILLTARELEPYLIFERLKVEQGVESHGGSPEELANVTAQLYFSDAAGE